MQSFFEVAQYKIHARFLGCLNSARVWENYSQLFHRKMNETSDVRADLSLCLELVPGWMNTKVELDLKTNYRLGELEELQIEKPSVSGRLKKREGSFVGHMTVSGDYPESIDFVMSTGLSVLCEASGDLLLHSSALTQDDHAYLFLGHGGAGKTTIAVELNGGRTPLSVDRTLVAFDQDGAAIAHSTPFGDRNHDLPGPSKAPIAGIFFIEQADEHEVLPVSPWEATRLILAQTIVPTRSRATVQKVMDAVGKLVDLDCCYKLRFKKDDGFWPLIDEALAKRK